jgi:thiol-disulfide isomerase/thioredoxin
MRSPARNSTAALGSAAAPRLLVALLSTAAGCASAPPVEPPSPVASRPGPPLCAHEVPAAECVGCRPERAAQYQASGDWCAEHGLPESHCRLCHPDLTFVSLPELPAGADILHVSRMGEDVPDLSAHLAPGKVTVFDFFAHWCMPCKELDYLLHELLRERADLAVRKINVMSWESAVARRYLGRVDALPFAIVFGKDGRKVGEVRGLAPGVLARLVEEGS